MIFLDVVTRDGPVLRRIALPATALAQRAAALAAARSIAYAISDAVATVGPEPQIEYLDAPGTFRILVADTLLAQVSIEADDAVNY